MPILGSYGAMAARAFRPNKSLRVRLLMAGGGAGGGGALQGSTGAGGGGGAGRLRRFASLILDKPKYAVIVGIGGDGGPGGDGIPGDHGGDGTQSSFGDIIAEGGGGGGGTDQVGRPGGSGGGGGLSTGGTRPGGDGVDIANEGHDGGDGNEEEDAGGGGAFSAGGPSVIGQGVADNITGTVVVYCKGGSTATPAPAPGDTPGSGGDSGAGVTSHSAGAKGANGAQYVRYAGPPAATGGVITTVGGDTLHTFTVDGFFELL